MSSKKKYLFLPIILIITFAIAMVSLTVNFTADAAAGTFVKKDEVVVAHITDTHYYPLSYCAPNGEGAFGDALISGTKLLLESSFIVEQGLNDVIKQNPDYLVVTGDITLNGELQGHLEMANLLRQLQNAVRTQNSNPDFQIFVIPGNHDIYNEGAKRYDNHGKAEVAPTVTRKDFVKIYSSLGYPDMTDAEIVQYYNSIEVLTTYLPYSGKFVNSANYSGIKYEYQYKDNGNADDADYKNGEITYIAYCENNYTFIGIDEEISGEGFVTEHFVGGKIYQGTKDYLAKKSADMKFENTTLVGFMHHNAVPHFDLEDTLLKDFTIYSWVESTDFLADIGIRNIFTGHMHSNDIVSHVSFNGNQIVDTETSSLTGYKGAVRYSQLQRGTVDGIYAENYNSRIVEVSATDISYLFTNKYMDANYLDICKLHNYVTEKDGKHIITSPSTYAVNKLFLNIIDSVVYSYLRPDFILGLGDTLGDKLPSILSGLKTIITPLISNIIYHLENVVLKDYTYGGTNELYKNNSLGYKLCGYLEELVDKAINISVNDKGTNIFDFFMGGYLAHVGGTDTNLANTSSDALQGVENFKNGSVVKTLLNMLLNKTNGLYPLVAGLTMPMDLARGFSEEQIKAFSGIFNVLLKPDDPKFVFDPHAVKLDDHIPSVLGILPILGLDLSFSMNGKTIIGLIDDTLEGYVTDSLYAGLGEIAGDIMYQFYVDESDDCNKAEYTTFYPNKKGAATYVKGAVKNEATINNGKLPSMLTVNFGEKTATDKNFVWFTDRRVTGTDIQFMEGAFNSATATKKAGACEIYATTTASIDLGIFATLLDVEVARHTVELTGLTPNTTYSYRVGSSKDNFWSKVYTFKTAPAANEAFEVLLITDLQGFANSTYENALKMMQKVDSVFQNGFDFVINCGDAVDNSANMLQYQYMLNTMMDEWGNTTQVNVTGNHEEKFYKFDKDNRYLTVSGANTSQYNYMVMHNNLALPKQDTKTGAYYSFDYGNVHFTVLNTNDIVANKLSDKQIAWLTNDLATTTAKFKVVAMHKGAYTAGSHISDKDVKAIRKQVTPIFADNKVSLVLQGHDHVYSESYYLDREGKAIETDATGEYKLGNEGVLYVNLGCAGDKFYKYVSDENIPIEFGKELHNPTLSNPTFGKLVYDGENLYYRGYQYDLATQNITEIRAITQNNGNAWWIALATGVGGAVLIVSILAVISYGIQRGGKNKKQ